MASSPCPLCANLLSLDGFSAGHKLHCRKCGAPLVLTEDRKLALWDAPGSGASKGQGFESSELDQTTVVLAKEVLPDFSAEGYRVFAKIGEGAMGTVYKAEQISLERPVAIKTLKSSFMNDPSYLERFVREAKVLARINHENILQVHDVVVKGDRAYMCLELIDGESLSDVLRRQGRLSYEEAKAYLLQTARGLGSAHEVGIVHRDIKPGNLMLTRKGVIKVADFGLASTVAAEAGLKDRGIISGTPLYMSPEQAEGEPADSRSDIYCLGATFFHLLAGRPPFTGHNIGAVLQQHIEKPPPDVRALNGDVPESMAALISQMMAKSPAERLADGNELSQAIQTLDGPPVPVAPPAVHLLLVDQKTITLQSDSAVQETSAPREQSALESSEDEPDLFDLLEKEALTSGEATPTSSPVDLKESSTESVEKSETSYKSLETEIDHGLAFEVPQQARARVSEAIEKVVEEKEEEPTIGAAVEEGELAIDLAALRVLPIDPRPPKCASCGAAVPQAVLYCTSCGRYLPSSEELLPPSAETWQRFLLKTLADPVAGKGAIHLFLLSAILGLALTGVCLITNGLGNLLSPAARPSFVRIAMTLTGVIVLGLAIGNAIRRMRVVLKGYSMGASARPDSPVPTFKSGLRCGLHAAAFFLLPVFVSGLFFSPPRTLSAVGNLPWLDFIALLADPVSPGAFFLFRWLGTLVQCAIGGMAAFAYPLSLFCVLAGVPILSSLHPRWWFRPTLFASERYWPAVLWCAVLLWIALPIMTFLFCIVPGSFSGKLLENGLTLNAGAVFLWLQLSLILAGGQFCLWSSLSVLARILRPRREFFVNSEPVRLPRFEELKLIAAVFVGLLLAAVISSRLLPPLVDFPRGAQTLRQLFTGG